MSENKEALLRELIDKYAKLYMKLACNSGVSSENAEDIVMEAFWSFYKSDSFGHLSEEETKIVVANAVKNICRDFAERKSECKKQDWMNTAMGWS